MSPEPTVVKAAVVVDGSGSPVARAGGDPRQDPKPPLAGPGRVAAALAVLIPSKTEAFLGPLLISMENSEPGSTKTGIYVGDNGLGADFTSQWPSVTFVAIPTPFVFARAINMLAEAAIQGHPGSAVDLFVLNDDTEITTVHWRTLLTASLDTFAPGAGMLALQIDGGVGNEEQKVGIAGLDPHESKDASKSLCFVAVIIPAAAWQTIGPLDERFVGYGFDDDDYTRRCTIAGLRCAIIGGVVVKHGKGGFEHSSSYATYLGHAEWNRQYEFNARVFKKKYGDASIANRLCLNIGCGNKPLESAMLDKWYNMDLQAFPGVQIVRDIRRGIPMPDETFDHVLMDNVLEHLVSDDVIFALNEIDRVLKVGGTAEIVVPHALIGQGAYQDPTHKSFFVPRSVLYWNQEMSAYGGGFVGITANLVPHPDIARGVQTFGNDTECFLRFLLRKHPPRAAHPPSPQE